MANVSAWDEWCRFVGFEVTCIAGGLIAVAILATLLKAAVLIWKK